MAAKAASRPNPRILTKMNTFETKVLPGIARVKA
jgi:hypothetical protein